MEKIFNFSEDFVRAQCRPRRVQSDSNEPILQDQDFFSACLEGGKSMMEDKELVEALREALGEGSDI